MTETEQRICIAEACGWFQKEHEEPQMHYPGGMLPTKIMRWFHGEGLNALIPQKDIPDYLHDLNAMHEAAMRLKLSDRTTYAVKMREIVMRDATESMRDPDSKLVCDLYFYEATASQRAEAFLRTIGKWKESDQ